MSETGTCHDGDSCIVIFNDGDWYIWHYYATYFLKKNYLSYSVKLNSVENKNKNAVHIFLNQENRTETVETINIIAWNFS